MIRTFSYLLITALVLTDSNRHARGEISDGEITQPIGQLRVGKDNPGFDEVIFINGMYANQDSAKAEAEDISKTLGCKVRLIYCDLTVPVVAEIVEAVDKLFDANTSLNPATETLIKQVKTEVENGREIRIIGYSGGSLILNNAVRKVALDYATLAEKQKAERLGRIHVLTIGSAVLPDDHVVADGWPKELGSIFHLVHKDDPIAQIFGPSSLGFSIDLERHFFVSYSKELTAGMLKSSGIRTIGPATQQSSVDHGTKIRMTQLATIDVNSRPLPGEESRASNNFKIDPPKGCTEFLWIVEGQNPVPSFNVNEEDIVDSRVFDNVTQGTVTKPIKEKNNDLYICGVRDAHARFTVRVMAVFREN